MEINMIKLSEIAADAQSLHQMRKWGIIAKKQASELLGRKGLEDPNYFVLRIKKMTKTSDWIALYRTNSILSRRPIFWINVDLPAIAREVDPDINVLSVMVDNILHEWWHAIMDMLRVMKYFRRKPIATRVSISPDKQEEEDAEDFMRWAGGQPSEKEKYFLTAIQEFNDVWESE